MKYYIIAGEASGDLHGGHLLSGIKKNDPESQFRCWGGENMEAAGARLVMHYRHLAFMGFLEVVKNLRTILNNLSFCKRDILEFSPDVVILIDYPGFNLRIAQWAKKRGFRVVYYISPQVWAWKENRVEKMRKCIDLLMVILPFEEKYFREKWNWEVPYVGHPLVRVVRDFSPRITRFSEKPVVALLPGSRRQEISVLLPVMLKASTRFPDYHFVVAMAPGVEADFYRTFTDAYQQVSCVGGLTYELLQSAKAAMVTSGTATLETALFKVPQVVCYKAGSITYSIAKRLVKIPYISLVNLIMDKQVVEELIQDQFEPEQLSISLQRLLNDTPAISEMMTDYRKLEEMLASGGDASDKAAGLIHNLIRKQPN